MANPVATLAGIPLEMDQVHTWALQPGPTPFAQAFEMSTEAADSVIELGSVPIELVLPNTQSGGDGATFKELYAIDEAPGSHPDRRRVIVADLRYRWPYLVVSRAYNIRRVTGSKFIAAGTVEEPVIPDVEKYAAYSLRETSSPWTLQQVTEDVLGRLVPGRFELRSPVPEIPVEDLRIEGQGDVAVQQLLRLLPGFSLYVDPSGVTVLYDMQEGQGTAELDLLSGLDPAKTRERSAATRGRLVHFPGAPGSRTVDWPIKARRSNMRASKVRVLFDTRLEFVASYNETAETVTRTNASAANEILARNVCTVTDPLLEQVEDVDGTKQDKAQGSVAEFGDATTFGILRAWEEDTSNNPRMEVDPPGPFSQETIRKSYMSGFAYVAYFYLLAEKTPSRIWSSRMSAARSDWRWLYRVDPHWWGRMEGLEGYRVAVVDTATGSRSPSPVFMDYMLKPNHLSMVRGGGNNAGLNGRLKQGATIETFGQSDISVTDKPTSPFRAVVISPGAGIFRAVPATDPSGEWDKAFPGKPAGELPSKLPADWNKNPIQSLHVFDQLELAQGFFMRTILTATRAYPPNEKRLHAVEVEPGDLGLDGLGDALGPVLELRVPPSILTAEFAWDDVGGAESVQNALTTDAPPRPDTLSNEEHVKAVAEALASAYYESIRDRQETNGVESPFDPEAEPAGVIAGVRHELRPDGACVSTFVSPKQSPQIGDRFWRFLPESTRNLILRTLPRG